MSGGLRFAPAPPNGYKFPLAGTQETLGPSPYTCPGVDKPPDTSYLSFGIVTRERMPVRAARAMP